METLIMRRIASASGLVLAIALAGCGSDRQRVASAGAPNNAGVMSLNQPVVTRTDYVLDVAVDGDGLAPGEDGRLSGWFDSMRLRYGDRVSVDDAAVYGRGNGYRAVARVAGRYGLLLSNDTPVTSGAPRPGQLRVIVSRSSAEVPDCPNWANTREKIFDLTSANYGCATNTNLAAMVANPEDLVRGQSSDGVGDPLATAKAIKSFRDKVPTGADELKSEKTGDK